MISRSRRKRRITAPSTRSRRIRTERRGWLRWAHAAVVCTSAWWATGDLLAAEPAAPRKFTPPAQSQPIQASSAGIDHVEILESLGTRRVASRSGRSSSGRRPAAVQLSLLDEHEGASSAVAAYTTGETSSRTIRPAAYDERSWAPRSPEPSARLGRRDRSVLSSPSDAMQDPFGDREEPQAVILAPAFTQEESVPMDELPAPVPPPAGARPPRPPKASAEDCQRIYNDRNCCDDEQLCEDARERLRRSPITSVSLDISPRFNPTLRSASDLPERERTFEEIERTWRDRSGQVVARGAMTGVRHGRVIIQTVDGRREEIALRRLSDDDICFFNAWWGTPNVCLLGDDTYAGRHFTPLTLTWKASALCHKPLYFEEVQLERYGHTTGPLVQPFLSGAHFFVNIAALPYRAGINPPSECMYALGYYRPGSCAPWLVPPVPLSVRGALAETAVVLGGVMLIP